MASRVLECETLFLDTADGIATITFNRPERLNAYCGQMKTDLFEAFDYTDGDDAVRAVIITATGKAFCAGADLGNGKDSFDYELLRQRGDGGKFGEQADGRDPGGIVTLRIFESLKPVICAINGAAVGFGATLSLAADARIATDSARFAFVFARLGLVPEAGSTWFLPKVVGLPTALDWCLSGRFIAADEATDAGLILACYPSDELAGAAVALARTYANGTSPVSVALTRRMLWEMAGATSPVEAHHLDSAAMLERGRAADAKEGIGAFIEKRRPVFKDSVQTWSARISRLVSGQTQNSQK